MTLLIVFALSAASAAGPLAPAADGKVQCYRPDVSRKTCHSISVIRPAGDGRYREDERVLVAPSPMIVFRNATTVAVEENAACGMVRAEDLDAGTFMIDGAPMDAERAMALHARVRAGLAPLLGKTICQTYEPRGPVLIQHSSIDGVARPELDEPVIWVSPNDGYSVAP